MKTQLCEHLVPKTEICEVCARRERTRNYLRSVEASESYRYRGFGYGEEETRCSTSGLVRSGAFVC